MSFQKRTEQPNLLFLGGEVGIQVIIFLVYFPEVGNDIAQGTDTLGA